MSCSSYFHQWSIRFKTVRPINSVVCVWSMCWFLDSLWKSILDIITYNFVFFSAKQIFDSLILLQGERYRCIDHPINVAFNPQPRSMPTIQFQYSFKGFQLVAFVLVWFCPPFFLATSYAYDISLLSTYTQAYVTLYYCASI